MILKHFNKEEFSCPSLEGSGEMMDEDFLQKLDLAREIANIPFKINSGYRTTEHNAEVGGKPRSSHLKGVAADISCTDSRTRSVMINALLEAGFNRLGIGSTFIHIDSDDEKTQNVIWTY